MDVPSLLLLFLLSLSSLSADGMLTSNYYQKSCPRVEEIIRNVVIQKQITNPTTAGGTLRLFFHDCFVQGCDASILITSTPFNKAERDADINLSLPGDGFDAIVRSKMELELTCPGVVSCADILTIATRDLVRLVGGPYYTVKLGRKDGLISQASRVPGNLPLPTMPVTELASLFSSKGFSIGEMTALVGAHTIGFSHCKEFVKRLYNFSHGSTVDPSMNPQYAQGLQKACANYIKNPTISAFNDIMTPNKFDNEFYQNLPKGLGLLASDQALYSDPRTRGFVRLFASNQTAFFDAFVKAIDKLSMVEVKVGRQGEIRRRCDEFNS
ncbi:peroxidase 31 isoform X2 [Nymphaea colorata]|uniref:peroxidase 31 isoform X2 n=1 Tax=Nymphaea colorata TaxID=210225 RepID=UPI00214F4901|nr:peroxidase 31 isoform X2 [Nymphaea colorata]